MTTMMRTMHARAGRVSCLFAILLLLSFSFHGPAAGGGGFAHAAASDDCYCDGWQSTNTASPMMYFSDVTPGTVAHYFFLCFFLLEVVQHNHIATRGTDKRENPHPRQELQRRQEHHARRATMRAVERGVRAMHGDGDHHGKGGRRERGNPAPKCPTKKKITEAN
jgi:hypothetical protein